MPGAVVWDVPTLSFLKLNTYVFPIPIVGDPKTLFKDSVGPVLYSIDWFSRVLTVLGFSTSKNVELIVSTSYPLTKALPGDIW